MTRGDLVPAAGLKVDRLQAVTADHLGQLARNQTLRSGSRTSASANLITGIPHRSRTGEGTTMHTADRHAWDYLVEQWGEAYEFEYQPDTENAYTCKRRDNGLLLAARTAESLHEHVKKDYIGRPVTRNVAP